ncbi:MAG: NHL domain-containing thioredoxin family protein [Rothia sp. (in: high G+C Gram-positive bacteria)]|nr:NHL domain-containing thioredoxin family protein [Rothia sp. (in: high G+C Gram-positive bacteria)]
MTGKEEKTVPLESTSKTSKVRASELQGRGWLNTGDQDLSLEKLRGKIVILDFWTFCCMNCLHVLDELRPLEEEFSDVLVTVGVHSPKFEHEADPLALAAAVDRYDITHPVLDDPNLTTWGAYTARAWPTLVVIDPEGYIVAHLSGEGHVKGLTSLVRELVEEHEAKGTLHRGNGPYVPRPKPEGSFAFPGKALPLPADLAGQEGTYLVTDTARHRLVQVGPDLETPLATFGGPQKGYADGDAATARFNEPQGLALVPADLRQKLGADILIADSVNHRIRGLRLADGTVSTLAGSGVQRLIDGEAARIDPNHIAPGADPLSVALSSPWDLVYSREAAAFLIAMAGTHQIFSFDPESGQLAVFAGTGAEGLKDGALDEAWFAQSSGIIEARDGSIWVADSETSALRRIIFEGPAARVETAVGIGLFDFGFVDGNSQQARMQHCLGLVELPDASIAVADTYNGAIRRYDPATGLLGTLDRGFAEPSDLLLEEDREGSARLIVVEANAHQLVRVAIPEAMQHVDEGAAQVTRKATELAGGALDFTARFSAPAGQKLDTRWGDPTQLKISSTPEDFILEGAGTAQGLTRHLVLNPQITEAVLHITARAAACDGEPGGEIPDHAACHLYQQDWGLPVKVTSQGAAELVLDLRGVNS